MDPAGMDRGRVSVIDAGIIPTEEAIRRLGGISKEKFRLVKKAYPELTKPVWRGYYSGRKINELVDILTGNKPQSPDHDSVIFGRLASGKDSREISASS